MTMRVVYILFWNLFDLQNTMMINKFIYFLFVIVCMMEMINVNIENRIDCA